MQHWVHLETWQFQVRFTLPSWEWSSGCLCEAQGRLGQGNGDGGGTCACVCEREATLICTSFWTGFAASKVTHPLAMFMLLSFRNTIKAALLFGSATCREASGHFSAASPPVSSVQWNCMYLAMVWAFSGCWGSPKDGNTEQEAPIAFLEYCIWLWFSRSRVRDREGLLEHSADF